MENSEESPRNCLRKRLGSVTEAPRLGFYSRKHFFSLISRDLSIPEGLNIFALPSSPIYRRKEGGGCRPARPGEQGCFHQKAPPSFGTLRKTQVGLVAICTPLLTKYTPLCFLLISFRNVAELYGLHNDTCFPSRMLRNFTDYATMLIFLPKCGETLRIMQWCLFRGFRRE